MKLGVSVVLGIIVTFIFYYIISFWVLADVSWGPQGTGGTLWVAFLLVLPVALFLGSILTGYLSYPSIDFKWELIYYSPGLYIAGICIVIGLFTNIKIFIYVLILGLYLYLTSLAGTTIGYLIRSRIRGDGLSTRKDLK